MIPERLTYLLQQYTSQQITPRERVELLQFLDEVKMNGLPDTVNIIIDRDIASADISEPLPFDTEGLLAAIFAVDKAKVRASETGRPVHRVHFLKTAWLRYAAAIIIIIGTSVYLWNNTAKTKETQVATTDPVEKEVMPGGNKATLTLSDGKRIELNAAGSGIITDKTLSIENSNGQLVYKNSHFVAFNTMTTPPGGQYKVVLPDGTIVWLNAASSITYPTAFTGKTREIKVTGEVYCEIKADPSKPFIVETVSDTITVLGTSFNINSYPNESVHKTTLIEGKLKIGGIILLPGQAAASGRIITTNVQQDVAWKNGIFNFEGQDLKTVMRQIERWYDVEVKYEGNIPDYTFEGKMDRGVKLSGLIRFLEQYGLTIQLTGKVLTVRR